MLNFVTDYPIRAVNRISASKKSRLGGVCCFQDNNWSAVGTKLPLSGMHSFARIVKNGSGGTLAPGAMVRWDVAGNGPGMEVDGVAVVGSNQMVAGVVNPWLTSNVADGATFLCFFSGPTKMLSTTGTAVSVGDKLTLGTASGYVDKYDVSSVDSTDTLYYCGTALEAVASGTASGTLFRAFVSLPFNLGF